MEFINIETTQNIDIHFKRASIGERIFAYAIDIVIFSIWASIWFYILVKLDSFQLWQIILTIPILLYSLFFELIFDGKTIGKMILSIKAVKLNGSELRLGDCLIRWIFRLVDIWIFAGSIGILSIILSKNSQRIGDLAGGTTVIKMSRDSLFQNTSFISVPDNYSPMYSNAHLLTDKDAQIIKEVLNTTTNQDTSNTNIILLEKTKNAIQKKLNLENQKENPKVFLETILKDYNYLNR